MLSTIGLTNFKCYRRIEVPFRPLTMLSGANGSGKSTLLQPLLIARQSLEYSRSCDGFFLNGSCVDLGRLTDVRNLDSRASDPIELTFGFDDTASSVDLTYALGEQKSDPRVAQILGLRAEYRGDAHTNPTLLSGIREGTRSDTGVSPQWEGLLPLENVGETMWDRARSLANFSRVHYLSAERLGPRDYHAKRSIVGFPNVGTRGEYTASILARMAQMRIPPPLILDAATTTLEDQAEAWLRQILGTGRVRVTDTDSDIVMLGLTASDEGAVNKPANVGFGYSYVLPLLVSGLIANRGDVLVIENPEAHLHPASQSKLAMFLAKVAANGVQVLLETHSDHILNGLRLAIKEKGISASSVMALYCNRDLVHGYEQIEIHEDGGIHQWPQGFFDQFNRDLSRLFED